MTNQNDGITMFICGTKACKHQWDGPWVEFENGGTTTCSLCGAWAINVSMLEEE